MISEQGGELCFPVCFLCHQISDRVSVSLSMCYLRAEFSLAKNKLKQNYSRPKIAKEFL